MLKKPQRIRLESEYKKILSKGRRIYSKFFTLFIFPAEKTDEENPTRFGFIASKKVGKAVARNRAKRLIREIIRVNLDNIKDGYELVVIISPNAVDQDFETLQKAVLESLQKAGLIEKN